MSASLRLPTIRLCHSSQLLPSRCAGPETFCVHRGVSSSGNSMPRSALGSCARPKRQRTLWSIPNRPNRSPRGSQQTSPQQISSPLTPGLLCGRTTLSTLQLIHFGPRQSARASVVETEAHPFRSGKTTYTGQGPQLSIASSNVHPPVVSPPSKRTSSSLESLGVRGVGRRRAGKNVSSGHGVTNDAHQLVSIDVPEAQY
jgi:hypothetical protein